MLILCALMEMSRIKLYQKIKNNYGAINRRIGENYPVEKEAELIIHLDIFLTNLMNSVGIQIQSYFTKAFKKNLKKPLHNFSKIKQIRLCQCLKNYVFHFRKISYEFYC